MIRTHSNIYRVFGPDYTRNSLSVIAKDLCNKIVQICHLRIYHDADSNLGKERALLELLLILNLTDENDLLVVATRDLRALALVNKMYIM